MIQTRALGALLISLLASAAAAAGRFGEPGADSVDPEVTSIHPRISPAVGVLLQDGSACERDSLLLLENLGNNTAWAVAMVDASAPGPQGALRGTTIQFGDFDECLALHGRGSPVEPQFCVVTLTAEEDALPLSGDGSSHTSWTSIDEVPPYVDVRRVILGEGQHYTAPSLREFGSGVCVPESCSAAQLEHAAAALLERRPAGPHALRLRASVQPALCTSHSQAAAAGSGRVWLLRCFAALFILVCVGTAADPGHTATAAKAKAAQSPTGWRSGVQRVRVVLGAWSIHRSLALLTQPMRPFLGVDMTPMAGARLFMALGVIAFHHQAGREVLPSSASRYIRTGGSALLSQSMILSLFAIDSFFFVSGLFFIPTFKRTPFRSVAHRIIRFLPLISVVTAFNYFLFPYLGSGAFWRAHSEIEVEFCRRSWWRNFLFISNHGEKCGLHLWTAAADVQLYASAAAVVFLFRRLLPARAASPVGVAEAALAVAASAVVRFVIAYRERWASTFNITARLHRNITDENFWSMYGSASSHIIPYVCGIFVGNSIWKRSSQGFALSKAQTRLCGWIALLLIPLLAQWNFFEWYHGEGLPRTAAPLRSSVVIVTSQLLQAFLWSLVTVLNSPIAPSNSLKRVFSAQAFLPLSRLTISTYLVHWYPIVLRYFSLRAPVDPSLLSDVCDGLGHVLLSFLLGFVLFLTVEAPLTSLHALYSNRSLKQGDEQVHSNGSVSHLATKLRSA